MNGNEDKITLVIGMPILHSVRVQRASETSNMTDVDKQVKNLK